MMMMMMMMFCTTNDIHPGYICNPLKVSFEILPTLTDKAQWRSIEAFNNVNKHMGHGLLAVLAPRIQFALVIISTDGTILAVRTLGGGDHFKSDVSDEYF